MTRRGYIVTTAAMVVGAAILTLFFGSGQVVAVNWNPGDRLVYSLSSRDVIRSTMPGSAAMHKRITMKGNLNVRVFSVSEDSIRLGMQFSPVEIRAEGQRSASSENIFAGLFFVDLDADGVMKSFSFNNKIAAEDEETVKSVVKKFQYVTSSGLGSSWDTEEKDEHGSFEARYRMDKNQLLKSKTVYLNAGGEKETSIEIQKSTSSFMFNKDKSWVKEVKARELLAFKNDGQTMLKTSSRISLFYTGPGTGIDLALWRDDLNASEIIAGWKALPKNTEPLAVKADREKIRKRYGTLDCLKIFKKILLKDIKFSSQGVQDMIRYLELYPNEALKMPELLREDRLNAQQRAMIVHTLGRTGHEKAQEALSTIMTDGSFKKENRVQAAVAFSMIAKPTEDSLGNLWQAYNMRGSADPGVKEVSATALLSLGNISSTLNNSSDDEKKALAEEIRSKLTAEFSEAGDLNTKVALMHAAGNTGNSEMIKPVMEFAESENDQERAAAMAALSRFKDEEVDEVLSTTLKNDKSESVRNAVVLGLIKREPTGKNLQTVMDSLNGEDNEIIRGGMYRYLVKHRDQPGVKEKLRSMLKTERSMEQRKIIYRALASRKK